MVVSSQLVNQLRQTQQAVLEARQEAEEAISNTEEGKIVAEATERIQALQEDKAKVLESDVQSIIGKLENWRSREPYDRRPTIYIGRLLRWQGRYAYAAKSLEKFIDYKRQRREFDEDYADVLYNKACYLAIDSAQAPDPGAKEQCLTGALEALEESIKYNSSNARDAWQDGDFDSIRDDAKFLNLVGQQKDPSL